ALTAALHALEDRGQEAVVPAAIAGARERAAGDEGDEAGQVLTFGAEAVGDPGAHRRATELRRPREEQQLGGGVVELRGVHRLDEAELVRDGRQMLDGARHPRAALAVLAEALRRAEQFRDAGREREASAAQERFGAVLLGVPDELRLVVKE